MCDAKRRWCDRFHSHTNARTRAHTLSAAVCAARTFIRFSRVRQHKEHRHTIRASQPEGLWWQWSILVV